MDILFYTIYSVFIFLYVLLLAVVGFVGWRYIIQAWKARGIELKCVYLFSIVAIILRILEFSLVICDRIPTHMQKQRLVITLLTVGKVSTMLTAGVGMAMACFFLDLYVAIWMITAIANNKPVKRMQLWLKCVKITFTLTLLTAFITVLGIQILINQTPTIWL